MPLGVTSCRTSLGNCSVRPSLCWLSTTSVTGPGQQRRARRRASGLMSGTKSMASSALLMARAKGAPLGPTFCLHQAIDRVGPAGAGTQSVHGLGRKRDELPFGQCLNSTMNNVARVLRVTNVDDDRRHGQWF